MALTRRPCICRHMHASPKCEGMHAAGAFRAAVGRHVAASVTCQFQAPRAARAAVCMACTASAPAHALCTGRAGEVESGCDATRTHPNVVFMLNVCAPAQVLRKWQWQTGSPRWQARNEAAALQCGVMPASWIGKAVITSLTIIHMIVWLAIGQQGSLPAARRPLVRSCCRPAALPRPLPALAQLNALRTWVLGESTRGRRHH